MNNENSAGKLGLPGTSYEDFRITLQCLSFVCKDDEPLPEMCYAIKDDDKSLVVIKKGKTGYFTTEYNSDHPERNNRLAERMNRKLGVSRRQQCAMIFGSMFGWNLLGAKPYTYKETEYIRPLWDEDNEQVKAMDDKSGNYVSQWLKDNEDYAWGFFKNDELIGYVTIGYADDCRSTIENYPGWTHDSLLLSDVYIKPEYRKHGRALKLIGEVIRRRTALEPELVFVTLLHLGLVSLYKKLGFKEIGDACMVKDCRKEG